MKVTWAVIISLSYFAAVYAHPARREGSEEIEFVPLEDQNVGPIVDTGVMGGPGWYSPFDGVFESFARIMATMRQQMDYLLKTLPVGNRTGNDSGFAGFPNIPELDLSKGNTTSVTKVIDGHKVVINETEYKQEGDLGGSYFKVRIIDVQPDISEYTTDKNAEEVTTPPKDQESVENSFENEIPKNKEIEDIESFDQPDSSHPLQKITTGDNFENFEPMESNSVRSALPLGIVNLDGFRSQPSGSSEWASLEPFESLEDNSIEAIYPPPDLSRDTYVNQLMADAGVPANPDAEVFSNMEYNVPYGPQRFEKITNPR